MKNEDFKKFFEEVSTLIKAIGTSSSVDQERDERSVENYVRQSANTNTNSQTGGNTMENTTEPDPQGGIAINKVINGETAPAGNESVSDAPNNPAIVPNNETFVGDGSAVAPSRSDEMQQPETVNIAKGATCPTCGAIAKGDESDADAKVEKAASEDEVTETVEKAADEAESKEEAAKETPEDEKTEMKKSIWGGAFAPVK